MAQEPTFNWDSVLKKPAQQPAQSVQLGPGISGNFHGDPKDLASIDLKDKNGIEQPIAPARPNGPTPGAEPTFNWDKVPTGVPTGTIGPEQHPWEAKINHLMNDIKYGPGVNDTSMPARLMRFFGYQGTNKGTSGDPGSMMGGVGAVEGIPELIHAGFKAPQVNSWKGGQRVANEAMGGAFKTLGGVAPFIAPGSVVPGMAAGLPRYAAGSTAAKLAGGDPETQEFVGDIAAAGTHLENEAGRKIGPLITKSAPAVGRAAGYMAAGGKMASDIGRGKFPNPLDLLFASPAVTRPVTSIVRGAGNVLSNLPSPLVETPGRPELPSESGPTTRDATTGRETTMPQGQTIEGEPLINKGGEPITEPPPIRQGLLRLEGEQDSLSKFNSTTDEILENLKAALQHVNESSPVDEKTATELQNEINEWQTYKDRVNQPDYENPYYNPREEELPTVSGGSEPLIDTAIKDLEKKAPVDGLKRTLDKRRQI